MSLMSESTKHTHSLSDDIVTKVHHSFPKRMTHSRDVTIRIEPFLFDCSSLSLSLFFFPLLLWVFIRTVCSQSHSERPSTNRLKINYFLPDAIRLLSYRPVVRSATFFYIIVFSSYFSSVVVFRTNYWSKWLCQPLPMMVASKESRKKCCWMRE